MAMMIPFAIAAAGSAIQAHSAADASRYNAQVMTNEQTAARDQGVSQENLVRRGSREALGRETAAFGGAGVGYGGSSRTALSSSAVNQELDALNTRYRAQFTGYGYGVQAGLLRSQATQEEGSGALLAGGKALQGLGKYYNWWDPNQAASVGP